jgi:hypothetical protein
MRVLSLALIASVLPGVLAQGFWKSCYDCQIDESQPSNPVLECGCYDRDHYMVPAFLELNSCIVNQHHTLAPRRKYVGPLPNFMRHYYQPVMLIIVVCNIVEALLIHARISEC